MVPLFPSFAPLQLAHCTTLDRVARIIGPYSDLNFVSLWCWNTTGATSLSNLYGNLVIRLQDYATGNTTLTFAGMQRTDETIATLLEYSEAHPDLALRLVPEACIVRCTGPAGLACEAEEDHADYLYDLGPLAALHGAAYQHKRKSCNRVEREHRPALTTVDLLDRRFQREALSLAERWQAAKGEQGHSGAADLSAIERCFHGTIAPRLTAFRLTIGGALAAFALVERHPHGVSLGHFLKADPAYPGLADFLMHQLALAQQRLGDRQLNTEQDLGLPGLRRWKLSWRPCGYLRKYRLTRKLAQL